MAVKVTITDETGNIVLQELKVLKTEQGEERSEPVLAARVAIVIERRFATAEVE